MMKLGIVMNECEYSGMDTSGVNDDGTDESKWYVRMTDNMNKFCDNKRHDSTDSIIYG